MITHEIKQTKTYQVGSYNPVLPGDYSVPRNRLGHNEHIVKNQEQLDAYLSTMPWVTEGTLCTYKSNDNVKSVFTMHVIVEVQRSYAALPEVRFPRPGGIHPRVVRLVCCSFNEHTGESSWQRWDDVADLRPLTEEECKRLVDDNLLNSIQKWWDANGYKEKAAEPAPSPI